MGRVAPRRERSSVPIRGTRNPPRRMGFCISPLGDRFPFPPEAPGDARIGDPGDAVSTRVDEPIGIGIGTMDRERVVLAPVLLPINLQERVLETSQPSSRALKNFGKFLEEKRLSAVAAPGHESIKPARGSSIVRRKGGRLEQDVRGGRRIQAAVSRGRPAVGRSGIRRLLDRKVSVGTCVLNYNATTGYMYRQGVSKKVPGESPPRHS